MEKVWINTEQKLCKVFTVNNLATALWMMNQCLSCLMCSIKVWNFSGFLNSFSKKSIRAKSGKLVGYSLCFVGITCKLFTHFFESVFLSFVLTIDSPKITIDKCRCHTKTNLFRKYNVIKKRDFCYIATFLLYSQFLSKNIYCNEWNIAIIFFFWEIENQMVSSVVWRFFY